METGDPWIEGIQYVITFPHKVLGSDIVQMSPFGQKACVSVLHFYS